MKAAVLMCVMLACGPSGLALAQESLDKPESLDSLKSSDTNKAAADTKKAAPESKDAQPPAPAPKPKPKPQAAAADERTKVPTFLSNAYFGAHLAYINYHFSQEQLEPGFKSGYLAVPHLAAKVDLFGYRFNPNVSIQTSYMRPGDWVKYEDVNGDKQVHQVWMNFGAVTVQAQAPLRSERVSGYVEGGFGVASRRGFEIDGVPVVKHAHYASAVLGAGLIYHSSSKWDLLTGVTYIPPHTEDKQPASAFFSTGFRYKLGGTLAEARIEPIGGADAGYIFPANVFQLEISTGHGFGVNKFFSSKVPIFWDGNIEVDRGVAFHYERNVYHTRRFFALDLGSSLSFWRSKQQSDKFATLSLYPLFRFTLVRTQPADFYFMYSVAGPTYITKRYIDGIGTGGNFTFQDFLGVGAFIGEKRNVNLGFKITHYSNGNLFVDNAALKVPITINLGYAF
jgi:hypothetical protein